MIWIRPVRAGLAVLLVAAGVALVHPSTASAQTPVAITLTPATASNTVGTSHTVFASVRCLGGPMGTQPCPAGVPVTFTVMGAHNISGTVSTDPMGVASFTYTGMVAGGDSITARSGMATGGATKTWTPGPTFSLTLEPANATNPVGEPHTVTATARDRFGNRVPGDEITFTVTSEGTPTPPAGTSPTDMSGEAMFTFTNTAAVTNTITATSFFGPSDTAEKTWTSDGMPGDPATLTLEPTFDTNPVGTPHTVTATVRDALGQPVPGVTVQFSVTGANMASGSDVTDPNGEASFTYVGTMTGGDLIEAYADTDGDGMPGATEPFNRAEKTWTPPDSTESCEVKITQGGWIIAANGDRASFGGNARVREDGSVDGRENYQDHGPAQPRHVQSIELTAVTCTDDLTMATIMGRATVDGAGDFEFRIDVTDQGEPGTNDSYGIMINGYASGQQRLQGGNVQIHKS